MNERVVTEIEIDARLAQQGVAAYEAALERAATATGKLENSTRASARAYNTVLAELDPVFAATRRLGQETSTLELAMKGLDRQVMSGAVGRDQYLAQFVTMKTRLNEVNAAASGLSAGTLSASEALGRLSTAHAGVAKSGNAAAFAMRDLGIQSIDVFQGMATGAPIMTTLIQQGAQVAQVMASSGVSISQMGTAIRGALGSALAAIVSPIGLLVTGAALAATGVIALGVAAESADRRLLAMQTTLRATRSDYAAAAAEAIAAGKAVAASSVFGTSESIAAAGIIKASVNFGGTKAQLADLVKIAGDVATVMGVTLPEQAKVFAQALVEPGKLAQEMADKHFFDFNHKLADTISLLEKKDRPAAFAMVIDQLAKSTGGAAKEALTPFQQALNNLTLAFTGGGEAGKGFAEKLGVPIVNMATGFVNSITSMVTKIEEVIATINKMPQWVIEAAKAGSAAFGMVTNPAGFVYDQAGKLLSQGSGPSIWSEGNTSAGLSSNQRALLDVISGPESRGQYNVRYGGSSGAQTFDTFATHPMVKERIPGSNNLTSDAAGRYQFLSSTYQPIADQLGLTDFSPVSQDRAAWSLASTTYKKNTGRDLDADLAAGRTADVAPALKGVWPSMPGGSQQGIGPTQFNNALKSRLTPGGTSDITLPETVVTADRPNRGAVDKVALDSATKLADSLSVYKAAHDRADEYAAALARLKASGTATADQIATMTIKLQEAQKAEFDAVSPTALAARAIDEQTAAARKIGEVYKGGYAAVAEATVQTEAHAKALTIAAPTAANFSDIVDVLATSYRGLTRQQQDNQLAAKSLDNQQRIEYLRAEVATVGMSSDARDRYLAVLKATQEIEKNEPFASAERKAQIIAEAGAISDLTTQLKNHQQALNEVGTLATNAFSTIGNAITQSMFQSGGAVVNFGTVAKAVFTQVAQAALQLAIINPLLNSVVGGNRSTLDTVGGALGSIFGGTTATAVTPAATASTSGGLVDTVSTGASAIGTASTAAQAFGFQGIGPALGLTGPGGALTGMFSAGGSMAGVGAAIGAVAVPAAIVAAGYFLGSEVAKMTPNPENGKLGALLLGTAGGLGGFIGPRPASAYSSTEIGLDNGLLDVGKSAQQRLTSSGPSTESDAATVNSYLTSNGLVLTSIGTLKQIGFNTPGGFQDPTKFNDVAAAFSGFGFSSTDPILDKFLSGRKYADLQTLEADITNYQKLVTNTIPPLIQQAKVTGSLNDALNQINAAYNPAIAAAASYGLATEELTAAQTKAIETTKAAVEATLVASDTDIRVNFLNARASLTGSAADAQEAALLAFDSDAKQRRETYKNQLIGVYGDVYDATSDFTMRMTTFNDMLGEQRLALISSKSGQDQGSSSQNNVSAAQSTFAAAQSALISALNSSISTTQNQISALTNNSAALRQASAGLRTFVAGLATSANSPLTPAEQLAAARGQFGTDIAGGTAASASASQGSAGTVLSLAAQFYGKASSAYRDVFESTKASLLGLADTLDGQISVADQSLSVLTKQLTAEQQQLAVAQTIGTQVVGSISDLTAAMMAAFTALQIALIASGQSPAAAGRTPDQAITAAGISPTDYIKSMYQTNLGREADQGGIDYYIQQVMSGGIKLSDIGNILRNSPEALAGHMAAGGWVGNGTWNKDSVLARFAGGGNIALAGGEFVVRADQAARYPNDLANMNAGTFGRGANDNSAILAEMRALRAEVVELRRTVAAGAVETVAELKTGNEMTGRETRVKTLAGLRR